MHEDETPSQIGRSFMAETVSTNCTETQLVGSSCNKTSDIDIGYAKPQRSSALVRSPTSRLLKRIPLSEIQNETIIHENRIGQTALLPLPHSMVILLTFHRTSQELEGIHVYKDW